ncbi:hypothetical protein ONZ45_g6259 [Pleurotus djamor]|nr:hypothetical protein ONZ45_g6259 [Pleurotus djamor]
MSTLLPKPSELGQLLYPLPGLNLYTSKGGILASCDPKHVMKRFATLLRGSSGIQVDDTIITPVLVKQALGYIMTYAQAEDLLNPADKQNVPKAVSLIQHLLKLEGKLPVLLNPSQHHHRNVIVFVAQIFGFFVDPFINVSLSLSAQVRSLSTYTHLLFAMFVYHGTSFMNGALYADSQAIVKNVIFTIARLQMLGVKIDYYLLLEGTDRLEMLFSDVRTQDHSRNVDILQLSQKLSVSAEINAIFARHPDLDRGHRRLNVAGALGIDHLNPKSWKGDVCVTSVNLRQEWTAGRDKARNLLAAQMPFREHVDFLKLFEEKNIDLLRPKGEYVGTRWEPGDGELELPTMTTAATTGGRNPDDSGVALGEHIDTLSSSELDCDDIPDGMEIEDFLDAEDAGESALVEYEGKTYYKSSLVAALLTSSGARKVTIRTQRARGVSIQEALRRANPAPSLSDSDGDLLKAGDLVACLARVPTGICIIVTEVLHFNLLNNSTQLSEARTDDLCVEISPKFSITAQILDLTQKEQVLTDEMGAEAIWAWTSRYIHPSNESSGKGDYTVVIPGFLAHPIDPVIIETQEINSDEQNARETKRVWGIRSDSLLRVRDQAWGRFRDETDDAAARIQQVPYLQTQSLPYKDMNGDLALRIESPPPILVTRKLAPEEAVRCMLCGKELKLKDMRNHVGHHILRHFRGTDISDVVGVFAPQSETALIRDTHRLAQIPVAGAEEMVVATLSSSRRENRVQHSPVVPTTTSV